MLTQAFFWTESWCRRWWSRCPKVRGMGGEMPLSTAVFSHYSRRPSGNSKDRCPSDKSSKFSQFGIWKWCVCGRHTDIHLLGSRRFVKRLREDWKKFFFFQFFISVSLPIEKVFQFSVSGVSSYGAASASWKVQPSQSSSSSELHSVWEFVLVLLMNS